MDVRSAFKTCAFKVVGQWDEFVHLLFHFKGLGARDGLEFAALGPAKPKAGLGHGWSKDLCVQSNIAGLVSWGYFGQ